MVQVLPQPSLAPDVAMPAMTSSSAWRVVAVVPVEQLVRAVEQALEAVWSSGEAVSIPEYSKMVRVCFHENPTSTVTPVPSAAPAIL